ncbi:inositol monophosphatase family protein [Streptomyces aureocirculatus]|uniref:inositol monophosphatase family protein n=1 Tax=Streptomyces aureocirculatus TaxID=67275 RepID=UPI00068A5D28|nr:inositol monophosphatase family protein [Streptomyces aureocirculatus]
MHNFMADVARRAGAVLADLFRSGAYQQENKSSWDLVTAADLQSEQLIIDAIGARFPGHGILAEESGEHGSSDEHLWLIDPLDGTINFARGLGPWGVSIAYAHRNEVQLGMFYAPETDELYHARLGEGAYLDGSPLRTSGEKRLSASVVECSASHKPWQEEAQRIALTLWPHARTLRMTGCGAGALCALAAGRTDAMVEVDGGPWDYAAGALIVHEAGGVATTVEGNAMVPRSSSVVAAATGRLHTHLTEALQRVHTASPQQLR